MLKIYKSNQHEILEKINSIDNNSIINMVNPTKNEIQTVSKELNLPMEFFDISLDKNQHPRIERHDNGSLIILNVPTSNENINDSMDIPYITIPIGIIQAKDHVVILSSRELDFVNDLIEGKHGEFQSHMKTRVLLLLFKAISKSYENYLVLINNKVENLQNRLRLSYKNTELFGLINLNKSLVFFSAALSAISILYKRISEDKIIKIHDDERRKMKSILADVEQSAEIIELRRESLSNLMDAYATIVHNNLNSVLKLLTTLAIIMIIPTMIGSIFSMNVELPYEHEKISTVVIGVGMSVISLGLLYLFYKKKYISL